MSAVITATHRPAVIETDPDAERRERIRALIARQVTESQDCVRWGYDAGSAHGWGERLGIVIGHVDNPYADQVQVRAARAEIVRLETECMRLSIERAMAEQRAALAASKVSS